MLKRDRAGIRSLPGGFALPLRFDDGGVRFGSSSPSARSDGRDAATEVSMRLVAFGRETAMQQTRRMPSTAGDDGRVVTRHSDALRQWWQLGRLGLEQGFDLKTRPAVANGSGPLVFRMRIEGAKAVSDGRGGIRLVRLAGVDIHYTDLFAEDAAGQLLPTRMRARGQEVDLIIDDREARYPLHIDPLVWVDTAKLVDLAGMADDGLGFSVSLSGDRALVGANLGDAAVVDAGAAYLFELDNGGGWSPKKLVASDGTVADNFGYAVAVFGDWAAVGAKDCDGGAADTGAVYVFQRDSNGQWLEKQKLVASDEEAGNSFGYALGLGATQLLIGAPNDNDQGGGSGSVYVFELDSTGQWNQQQKLVALDVTGGDTFGSALSLYKDKAIIGAKLDDDKGASSGSAYIYARDPFGTWVERQKLVASDGAALEAFGFSVAMGDGRAVVGARYDDDNGTSSGSAYIFEADANGNWTEVIKLLPSDGVASDHFGKAVAIAGNRALIGAYGDDDKGSGSGSAYIFERASDGSWSQGQKLLASDGQSADLLGSAVAAEGGRFLVGAPFEDDVATGAGAAYIFDQRLAVGDACVDGLECASAFCVDGVCCDSFCGGGDSGDCQACSVAAGATVDGTCSLRSANTECRASAGSCDVAEVCDGQSDACPADAKAPINTTCRASAGACDVEEVCDGLSDLCPADVKAPANAVCRSSAGACDVVEVCDGTSAACPLDAVVPAGLGCRPSVGACDTAEVCDGSSTACPPDAKATANTECRVSAGVCDAAEFCDGQSDSCPPDLKAPASITCRGSAGLCDLAEFCDGQNNDCPVDKKAGSSTLCRASAGACDLAEVCDGQSDACPADVKAGSETTCRTSAGACDEAEVCDGQSDACPADEKVAANTECRASAGVCDVAEVCDGQSDSCPEDSKVAADTECRESAGACDVAEVCDGQSDGCPEDAKAAADTECRASAGACDVAEVCDGQSAACPVDALVPAGLVCRSQAGACDVEEACDGQSAVCPEDAKAEDGLVCGSDGGSCEAGECQEPQGSGGGSSGGPVGGTPGSRSESGCSLSAAGHGRSLPQNQPAWWLLACAGWLLRTRRSRSHAMKRAV